MHEDIAGGKQENTVNPTVEQLLSMEDSKLLYAAMKMGLNRVGEEPTPSEFPRLILKRENKDYLKWIEAHPEFSDPRVEKRLLEAYEKSWNDMVTDDAFEQEGADF